MNTTQRTKVLVIGAGPAGLMAAGQAAGMGASVLLLEKMDRPGTKLSLTGNGRGNLTHQSERDEFCRHFNGNNRFVKNLLGAFSYRECVAFFESLGVATSAQDDGRVFPVSNRARDLVDALTLWNTRAGVATELRSSVETLNMESGAVTGVTALHAVESAGRAERRVHTADAVIVAAGGSSYPHTGSSGDGFSLARQAGHTVVTPCPGLVPLNTAPGMVQQLQGLSLADAGVSLWVDGTKQQSNRGEILFTHFGVSGPCILDLSRRATVALREGHRVEISIDLAPDLDDRALDIELLRRIDRHGALPLSSCLKGFLPKRLVEVAVSAAGRGSGKPAHQVSAKERTRLRRWIKDARVTVTGDRGFGQAMVTAGGVDVAEIDPRAMSSRKVRGLYFAGEIIDIDADTGGYNLQAAFSTGYVAGKAAALWGANQAKNR